MIKTEETWDFCDSDNPCGQRIRTRKRILVCDCCEKVMDESLADYLEVTAHNEDDDGWAKEYHYCSWACFVKDIANVKSDYFIHLPNIVMENTTAGCRHQDFLAAIGAPEATDA